MTAQDILEGDREEFFISPSQTNVTLKAHGFQRGTGEDDYNGANNIQDILIWLGY